MAENKVKKYNKVEVCVKEISSGILDENNAFILGIGIPGRGKLKIDINFGKEKRKPMW